MRDINGPTYCNVKALESRYLPKLCSLKGSGVQGLEDTSQNTMLIYRSLRYQAKLDETKVIAS